MTSSNGIISTLLALCAGNSPVTGEFPTQRPLTRSFDVFYDLRLNGWINNCEAGDLRRHRTHYDVTVMNSLCFPSLKIESCKVGIHTTLGFQYHIILSSTVYLLMINKLPIQVTHTQKCCDHFEKIPTSRASFEIIITLLMQLLSMSIFMCNLWIISLKLLVAER